MKRKNVCIYIRERKKRDENAVERRRKRNVCIYAQKEEEK